MRLGEYTGKRGWIKKPAHENFWGGRYAYYLSVTLYMPVNILKEKKARRRKKGKEEDSSSPLEFRFRNHKGD